MPRWNREKRSTALVPAWDSHALSGREPYQRIAAALVWRFGELMADPDDRVIAPDTIWLEKGRDLFSRRIARKSCKKAATAGIGEALRRLSTLKWE